MGIQSKPVVVIMAGGTGGHIFPGLAIAKELVDRGYSIHWLGTLQGMEANLIPQNGYSISFISIKGVKDCGLIAKLKAPFKIIQSIYKTLKILKKIKPKIVLGMGGFVSGPGAVSAKLLKIPLIIHEQNAVAGFTNKVSAIWANKILTGFPDVFKKYKKSIWTGNPVRSSFIITKKEGKNTLKTDAPLNLLILGGSRGALAINEIIPETIKTIKKPINIWHQTGKNHKDKTVSHYKSYNIQAKVESFICNIHKAYEWTDLVICRSGALTVTELANCGKAAIFIPYPWHKDQQQFKNALYLQKKGAAIIIEQKILTASLLSSTIERFDSNRESLKKMGSLALGCAKPEATKTIADICKEVACE